MLYFTSVKISHKTVFPSWAVKLEYRKYSINFVWTADKKKSICIHKLGILWWIKGWLIATLLATVFRSLKILPQQGFQTETDHNTAWEIYNRFSCDWKLWFTANRTYAFNKTSCFDVTFRQFSRIWCTSKLTWTGSWSLYYIKRIKNSDLNNDRTMRSNKWRETQDVF